MFERMVANGQDRIKLLEAVVCMRATAESTVPIEVIAPSRDRV